ncbi:putative 3-hydroxybutyryl-CoA dehydrogenase [bioreactor metagenome]|uniref:Putative 3-hydroxybutyryl-CoA dehydrogenase n=1 Tax=bioreactor metagenome TaxID=1076179 RepID=A0A645CFN1_9ZZZZ
MGQQIALNAAQCGYPVALTDSFPAALEKAETWAKGYVAGRVAKGKMTENQAADAQKNITFVPQLADAVQDADLIIEAIIEDRAIKEKLFTDLNKLVAKDVILATNSSFMVSSLFAGCVENPGRLANFHYFNPALVMKLVEVVQGPHTSEETVQVLMDFARKNGKTPIWVRKEIDGFIANRLLRAVKNEACFLLEEGVATAQEIDTAAENGLNYPMGPFRLMDLTGVDLAYLASKRVLDETGVKQPGFDKIKEKYEAGEWGRKSGKGWYDYSEKK